LLDPSFDLCYILLDMAGKKNFDLFEYYNFCENNDIIFSFNGKMSGSTLKGIITVLEDVLIDHDVENNFKRRIISIIIELTQNIERYSYRRTIYEGQENGHGMLIVRKVKKGFQIHSGNLLPIESGEELKRYCNEFIKLSPEMLKYSYMKKLKAKKRNLSNSAGIGLIYILRKSNSQMEIKSYKVDERNMFLSFTILVN
jgi:hypothetical protein